MSERGSFVTEYIYCPECFKVAREILIGKRKYLCSQVVKGWGDIDELPIISGKIGGLSSGEELVTFEYEINVKLSNLICHSLRIAVLAECGERIFTVHPDTKE